MLEEPSRWIGGQMTRKMYHRFVRKSITELHVQAEPQHGPGLLPASSTSWLRGAPSLCITLENTMQLQNYLYWKGANTTSANLIWGLASSRALHLHVVLHMVLCIQVPQGHMWCSYLKHYMTAYSYLKHHMQSTGWCKPSVWTSQSSNSGMRWRIPKSF